jgi:hypothetical protein
MFIPRNIIEQFNLPYESAFPGYEGAPHLRNGATFSLPGMSAWLAALWLNCYTNVDGLTLVHIMFGPHPILGRALARLVIAKLLELDPQIDVPQELRPKEPASHVQ